MGRKWGTTEQGAVREHVSHAPPPPKEGGGAERGAQGREGENREGSQMHSQRQTMERSQPRPRESQGQ